MSTKSERTGKRRHLRRTRFDRLRLNPEQGTPRSGALLGFLERQGTRLAATPASVAFTADFANNEIDVTAHGLATGDGPFHLTTATTLPAGLELLTDYWVSVVNANSLQLHRGGFEGVGGVAIAFTDAGTGAHAMARPTDVEGMFHTNRANDPLTIAAATDIDDLR